MSRFSLLLRSLLYFRRANVAVVLGMAVATAVLTGALLVGESVRGSLRELALRRMGPVDQALVTTSLFRQDLGERLRRSNAIDGRLENCAAGLMTRGGSSHQLDAGGRTLRTAGVQIAALEDSPWLSVTPGAAIANAQLRDDLKLRPGDEISLALPTLQDTPADATLAQRSRTQTTSGATAKIAAVADEAAPAGKYDDFAALFSLAPGQRVPRNLWLNLRNLQDAVDQPGRANLLLAGVRDSRDPRANAAALNVALRNVITLDDFGLLIEPSKSDDTAWVAVARGTFIPPAADAAIASTAQSLRIQSQQVMIYLVNSMEKAPATRPATREDRALSPSPGTPGEGRAARGASRPTSRRVPTRLHYLIAAGISDVDGAPLGDDEVAVNQWTADQLGLRVGDRVRFTYYLRQSNGKLIETASDREDRDHAPGTFRVARILPMSGIGADPALTPAFKGLTDTDSIANWNPPRGLKIDKKLVTRADEDYWHDHRAGPKIFLNLATARKLWGSAYGDITGVRLAPRPLPLPAWVPPSIARIAQRADAVRRMEQFGDELPRRINPADLGLSFRAIKAEQLAAAGGSTDFAELFIGFSFFLIVAAALLVAMLFRLNIEQRARQFGLLSALGFSPKRLRRMALCEGAILAIIGGVLGTALAIGYTALVMHGLRTWWVGAVGTTSLRLHVAPSALLSGFAGAFILAMLAIWWAVRRIGKAHAASLLAGGWGIATSVPRPHRVARITSAISFFFAIALLLAGTAKLMAAQGAFLGTGFLLLSAALTFLSTRLRPIQNRNSKIGNSLQLATRNITRRPARSVLSISLIALATFILVTVASMRQGPPRDTSDIHSGAGGFRLILQSDIPLLGDINTPAGRDVLEMRDVNAPVFGRTTFVPMRSWAGQDASCLNLTRPDRPTVLAVPSSFAERDAFEFDGYVQRPQVMGSFWGLLDMTLDNEDEVPVIADHETAQYILKLPLDGTIVLPDQTGRSRTLRLVATLKSSVFQSVLLMGDANFQRLFPHQSGASVVLIDCGEKDADELRRLLPEELADYSVTVDSTADRLAMYQGVQNTYLSTFESLGALGLMLGTIGLAVVLLRNLFERRAELALLSAIGFAPSVRLRLVLAENALLLILGLFVGLLCALLAISPTVLSRARELNLTTTAAALAATLVIGLAALSIATVLGARRLRPADLRSE